MQTVVFDYVKSFDECKTKRSVSMLIALISTIFTLCEAGGGICTNERCSTLPKYYLHSTAP